MERTIGHRLAALEGIQPGQQRDSAGLVRQALGCLTNDELGNLIAACEKAGDNPHLFGDPVWVAGNLAEQEQAALSVIRGYAWDDL